MAAVLLTILKILGTVLLVVLSFLLIIVLVVLFVPIRYLYKLCYDDEQEENNCHYVDVSWICKLIRIRVYISLSGVNFEARLFGLRCKSIEELLKRQLNANDNDDIIDDDLEEDNYMNMSELFEDKESLDGLIETYDSSNDINEVDLDQLIDSESKDIIKENKIGIKTNKKDKIINGIKKVLYVLNPRNWLRILASKIQKILICVKKFFIKFITIIKDLRDSILVLIHKVSLVIDFLDRPSTIRGIDKVKEYICITCKHILPTKKKVLVSFGFDNPADTGQVLAIAGVFYPMVGEFIEVYPNFENKELKADCYLKGRVRGINVVIIAIKVMRDKAIKRLIHNLNKLKEEL